MTSTIELHPGPGADFGQPFEMLDACHRRVERMLDLLERLAVHLAASGADRQAQQAARDVMRYFDEAAPHHHEDEERHVLPLLRAHGQAEVAARIAADHQAMHAAWADVRRVLSAIAQARWQTAQGESTAAQWRDFAALYRSHIELEEREAYPAALAAIGPEVLQAMGAEMARRRGAR